MKLQNKNFANVLALGLKIEKYNSDMVLINFV